MALYALGDLVPQIHPDAFVHPDAVIIGDVTIGARSSVWPCAVLRGDHGKIVIGEATSVQDGVVIHVSTGVDTIIGSRVVIGHNAHIEGATVEDDVLIGSGSVLLHRVHAFPFALVAAGAVCREGTQIPSRAMAVGVPAVVKEDRVEPGSFQSNVDMYLHNVDWYRKDLRRLD